jgi:hypothetical protein
VKIYKNYEGWEVFVSRVQTELAKLISRLGIFPGLAERLTLFEIP